MYFLCNKQIFYVVDNLKNMTDNHHTSGSDQILLHDLSAHQNSMVEPSGFERVPLHELSALQHNMLDPFR